MIKTMQMDDGSYLVSENEVWVEGRYESKEDATLACDIAPDKLHEIFNNSFNGLIKHNDLQSLTTE